MYQPPAGNNVVLRFDEAYTPPIDGGAVILQFRGQMAFSAIGGAISGGSAVVDATNLQIVEYTTIGGSVVSGEAEALRSREFSAIGGAVVGGISATSREVAVYGIGGAVSSGVALNLFESSLISVGGGLAGGNADLLAERRNILVTANGGAIVGGEAVTEPINLLVAEFIGSGGAVAICNSETNRESSMIGSGGAVATIFSQSDWPVFDGSFDVNLAFMKLSSTLSLQTVAVDMDNVNFDVELC